MKTLYTPAKISSKTKLFVTALSLMLLPGLSQAQILAWQFGNPAATGLETNINATTTDAHLAASALSRTNVNLVATAQVRTYMGTNFTQTAKGDQGFVFNITPASGYAVSLTTLNCKLRNSGSTSTTANYRWQYSLDGTNFNDIGTADIPLPVSSINGTVQAPLDLSVTAALQNVTVPIVIRLVAWNLNSTTASFGVGRSTANDVTPMLDIAGTVVPSVPLPVSLQSFNATAQGVDVMLNWATAAENNSSCFNLERSINGKDFAFISKVVAKNNASGADYTYTDRDVLHNGRLYYRLQSVDLDGKSVYSNVVTVNKENSQELLLSLYPNPALHFVTLESNLESQGTVSIFNAMGQMVLIQKLDKGLHKTLINTNAFAKGMYIVKLEANQKVSSRQLAIQ